MMDGHKVPTTNKTPREKRTDVAAVLQLHMERAGNALAYPAESNQSMEPGLV